LVFSGRVLNAVVAADASLWTSFITSSNSGELLADA
jgi:hypothetical protein